MMKRGRRTGTLQWAAVALFVVLVGAGGTLWMTNHQNHSAFPPSSVQSAIVTSTSNPVARELTALPIKGRAPMTGYTRTAFATTWATTNNCDTRDRILERDLVQVHSRSTADCTVLNGILHDPYTGKTITFVRGVKTSSAIQIDHVVAIGDAWQTGAQSLSAATRLKLYNDPLELLAVDGPINEQKGDGDAATWLPPNTAFRCTYVARQIAIKYSYHLWVTQAEHDAIQRVLTACPHQSVPNVQ